MQPPEFHHFRTMRGEEVPATSGPELSFIYCLLNADSNKASHQWILLPWRNIALKTIGVIATAGDVAGSWGGHISNSEKHSTHNALLNIPKQTMSIASSLR